MKYSVRFLWRKMKNNLVALLFAGVVLGTAHTAVSQEPAPAETTSARLCQVNIVDTLAARTKDGACVPPYYENEGGLCVSATEAHNAFTYTIKEDKSLDFGLSYWFNNGAHCGIIGNAKATAHGWRYEDNMDSPDPAERCAVDITIEGDAVFFDADPNATCRRECGASAYLSATFIPLSALESKNPDPPAQNPEDFYNTTCKNGPR